MVRFSGRKRSFPARRVKLLSDAPEPCLDRLAGAHTNPESVTLTPFPSEGVWRPSELLCSSLQLSLETLWKTRAFPLEAMYAARLMGLRSATTIAVPVQQTLHRLMLTFRTTAR